MRYLSGILCVLFCLVCFNGIAQNKVMQFDGVNDYLDLGSMSGNNIRTIELWFKPAQGIDSNLTDYISLVQRNTGLTQNDSNEFGIAFNHLNARKGAISFHMKDPSGTSYIVYSDSNKWKANIWYHVAAVVHPQNGMRLYIDGFQQNDSNLYVANTGHSNAITAAARWGNVNIRHFNGSIDDLKFYTSARYTSDFTPECPDSNSTIANHGSWHFNANGPMAIDSNITHFDATIFGAVRMNELLCTQLRVGLESNDLEDKDVLIYPNPTKGLINLSIDGEVNSNLRISLTDISGKEILNSAVNSNSTTIDLETYPDGIYFYTIFQNGLRFKSGKLIKH